MIVTRIVDVDLDAGAELAGVFVKSRFEPALAQAAAAPPPGPPRTLGQEEGKGAAAIRGAQGAFQKGDYDRAVSMAQSVLREDPGNRAAKSVLENALNGQKATTHFAAARSALGRSDFTTAESEARAGSANAPWDSSGPSLLSQIHEARLRAESSAAQQKAQQAAAQRTAEVNELLGKADEALAKQQYDGAISLYDSEIGLDGANQRAILGKSSAGRGRWPRRRRAEAAGRRPGSRSRWARPPRRRPR